MKSEKLYNIICWLFLISIVISIAAGFVFPKTIIEYDDVLEKYNTVKSFSVLSTIASFIICSINIFILHIYKSILANQEKILEKLDGKSKTMKCRNCGYKW